MWKQTAAEMVNCTVLDRRGQNQTSLSPDDIGFFCYYYIIFLLITVINLCGNSLVIVSSLRRPHLRTPENYFIISLATSDILHGMVYTVYNISHMELAVIKNTFSKDSVLCIKPCCAI